MNINFRLHIGLSTAFTLIILCIIGGIVAFTYFSNAKLAINTASRAMDDAADDVFRSVENLLDQPAHAVDIAADLVGSGEIDLKTVESLKLFFKQIYALPQVYGMYIGFETDGAFYQVVRVLEGIESFGPAGNKPKPETRFAIRILDGSSGNMGDRYIYLSDWGQVTGVERGRTDYDPRKRPWYQAAEESLRITISAPYTFSSTGKPGLTISRVASARSGELIGAIGADITLEGLASYLDQKRVGKRGRVFILDSKGEVIVQSTAQSGPSDVLPDRLDADAMELAIKHFSTTGEAAFTLPGTTPVMAAFKPFPTDFGKSWVIGTLADQNDFVQEIKRTTLHIILVTLVLTGLGVIAITLLSRRMTNPLRQITAEAERIRNFRLDDVFSLSSSILEINDLVGAVERMKNSLRSFGAYVPVDLVRSIVSSGTAVQVGGQKRELTLLFSDIEDFTKKSETLTPEAIFTDLSAYLSAITETIRQHGGTVDKFIGDAVMAFWNAPLEDHDHEANACRAALACLDACKQLNSSDTPAARPALFPLATRFALHSGEVMVGNIGSNDRMQYTALGTAVNLASRIEALNKRYGTYLLITEPVADKVSGQFVMRKIDVISPAGVTHPIAIYELVAEIGDDVKRSTTREIDDLHKMWEHCLGVYQERDWEKAIAAFRGFLDKFPEDGPAKHYLARCEAFSQTPPSPDWDGVMRYEEK